MKIDSSVKTPGAINGAPSARASAESKAGTASASAPASSTKVELSAFSSLGLDGVLANAPVSNAEKVAEIKQAISEGRFQINPEKIADGLLDSVRQMLNK